MKNTIAIHQPNYLPWLGYFYKILHCDAFVFLDNVQYERRGFTNRNMIKTSTGNILLSVSVHNKGEYTQLINEVKIDNTVPWKEKHWKSIRLNYARSPYFKDYEPVFAELYQKEWDRLGELNKSLILACCKILKINNVNFVEASQLDVSGHSTDLLVNICRGLGGDSYLSGLGAKKYTEEEKFTQSGIGLKYSDFKHPVYRQQWGDFLPNMSIIDLLFNEGENSLQILKDAHQ